MKRDPETLKELSNDSEGNNDGKDITKRGKSSKKKGKGQKKEKLAKDER